MEVHVHFKDRNKNIHASEGASEVHVCQKYIFTNEEDSRDCIPFRVVSDLNKEIREVLLFSVANCPPA